MFHLSDRQLHILLGGLCGATFLLLCIFALLEPPQTGVKGDVTGLSDYSQGWIVTYQTTDAKVLQAYQKETGNVVQKEDVVQQVVNLPAIFAVEKGNVVTLTHKMPEMGQNTTYIVIDTRQEQITVSVQGNILYASSDKEGYLPARHVIAVDPQYRDQTLQIELKGMKQDSVVVQGIYEGSYSQVLLSAWLDNGYTVILGVLLVFGGLCFGFVGLFVHNKIRNKRPLLYSVFEMLGIGIAFLLESRLVRMMIHWETGRYLLESAVWICIAVSHILVIRSMTYKKRMLTLLDAGCLFCGIFYISVMVLQGFSLIHLDTIRILSIGLLIGILAAGTIALAVAVVVYQRRENRLILTANGILVAGILLQVVHTIMQDGTRHVPVYIIAGIVLYEIVVLAGAMWQALRTGKEEVQDTLQERGREQVLEELNPNLLFASFHTLQNLIKNGSANSAKMLYYISVYFRNNLKAIKQPFEMIPFEEELEHILAYLTLQKTRNPKLSFSVECKVKEFSVPRRCMEPMVENAVFYGIGGRQNQGNVVIRTYVRQEGYAVQIIDDGIGFETTHYKKANMTSLKTILEQLQTKCNAKTEVVSRPGKGTVITMILPIPEIEIEE